jgi:hypothetical protein
MQLVADALPNVEAVILVTDNATAMSATVAGVDVTVASDMRFYHQRKSMDLLFEDPEQGKKVRVFQLAREGYPVGDMAESWLCVGRRGWSMRGPLAKGVLRAPSEKPAPPHLPRGPFLSP